jgi:pyruvate formate lyase activating enzyme
MHVDKAGLVFDIQRFSVHDGPGIRTTVFMKGCPLNCPWCSNPESVLQHPEIMVRNILCVACWKCIESCPIGAITRIGEISEIDRKKCNLCLECIKACPSGALRLAGKYMSVSEVMEEIEKDNLFYINSGGGVTISGGEPLVQAEFVEQVFGLCRQRGIHTTLDTTGHAPWPALKDVLAYTDLVLYDIKHLDSKKHQESTGRSNEIILNNLSQIAGLVETWLRLPLIPNFNDSESYIRELAMFIHKLPKGRIAKVSLLPYHNWGEQKYEELGKKYSLHGTQRLPDEHINGLKGILESNGLKVSVGS